MIKKKEILTGNSKQLSDGLEHDKPALESYLWRFVNYYFHKLGKVKLQLEFQPEAHGFEQQEAEATGSGQ